MSERWDWEYSERDATARCLEATPLRRLLWLDETLDALAALQAERLSAER